MTNAAAGSSSGKDKENNRGGDIVYLSAMGYKLAAHRTVIRCIQGSMLASLFDNHRWYVAMISLSLLPLQDTGTGAAPDYDVPHKLTGTQLTSTPQKDMLCLDAVVMSEVV